MTGAWTVFRKELVDALRDRRTLAMVVLSAVALGPILLLALSGLVAQFEARAERRVVMVSGIEHAPTLRNYLERQTYTIRPAPADYEKQLNASQLEDAVVVIAASFEAELARGESPLIEVVSSSSNQRAEGSVGRISQLLSGFSTEQSTLRLAMRGVAPATLRVVSVHHRDLANPQARAARITSMLPFFMLMALAYGTLVAALDTTAGERERGSLEPLLMNPASPGAIAAGKWAAVTCVGMLIAALACFSFVPGQWLLRSETLAAMFQFDLREATLFLALLAPFAAALSALVMAVSIRCKSFKEAQTNNTLVILAVSLLPLVVVFNQEGERPWHLWVPVLGQSALMTRVLKGEALTFVDVMIPLVVALVVAAACVAFVAASLRKAAVR
jgi:sodium transport system permease protein